MIFLNDIFYVFINKDLGNYVIMNIIKCMNFIKYDCLFFDFWNVKYICVKNKFFRMNVWFYIY